LADVVWDHQLMPGSMVEEGYALESEVGLFAMKREQAYRQMAPFDDANIEVDIVQLAPISLYNMVAYDRMSDRLESEVFDADNPPPSSVLLSIGTDSSDLIVTNGFRIWQRSMPIGGNHFTRQLTKDLKLTFAKAEHLKRNAREAVDPKLVFQTMRPVFNDLVTEVQRSIGFFRSIDKKAEITELLLTGNTVKMPGLAAYLGKNLGFEVHVLDRFNRLVGDDVLTIPTFRDNAPTFAVCYGLCLQGLGLSQINASLVPQEILTARMIRAKKPWTLAGLAALMIGMAGHYAFTERSWQTTHPDLWQGATTKVTAMSDHSSSHKSKDGDLTSKLDYLNKMGEEVSGDAERRLMWMEMIRAINAAIPRDPDGIYVDGKPPSLKELPLEERKDIHVTQFDTKFYDDLKTEWFTEARAKRYRDEMRNWADIMDRELPADFESITGPEGPGWVIQLQCYHYYNSPAHMGLEGSNHVRKYMTTGFIDGKVELPVGVDENGNPILEEFTFEEMGLTYPLLLDDREPTLETIANPEWDPEKAAAQMAAQGGTRPVAGQDPDFEPPTIAVQKLEFVYQLVWQEQKLSDRLEAKRLAAEAAAAEAEATSGTPDDAEAAVSDDSVAATEP
jgi:type IV pilus assembly protein PilM